MNKLITGLVVAILLLSTAGIGMAADNKPDNVPPDVQKITFVHYAKPDDNSKPIWDDKVDVYKLLPSKMKWDLDSNPHVVYEVYTQDCILPSNDDITAFQAITDSLDIWNAALDYNLFDAIVGTDTNYDADLISNTGINSDDRNVVIWTSFEPTNAIAMTTYWYYRGTGEIIESDVRFNTYYPWSTSGSGDRMDVQNIATHEFGHNGLNDLYMTKCTELTMYGYSEVGETKKRSLGAGDVSGIQALYGE